MKSALWLLLALAAVGALGYGAEQLITLREATAPPSPEAFVQAAWTVYRFGPGHRVHVDGQGLDCSACHRATAESQRFDRPGPGTCTGCHEAQSDIEHAQTSLDVSGHRSDAGTDAGTRMTDCLTCHGFGPDPRQQPTNCLSCHARGKGDVPAVVTHAQEECTRCHDVHENRIEPIACQQCHPVAMQHGRHAANTPAQCLDCHSAHGTAELAQERCRDCHAPHGEVPVPAAATAGAHTCTGCHRPHAFAASEVAPCTTCHGATKVLPGAGHTSCTSCHAPHAPRASVEQRNVCTTCHARVALSHPADVDPSEQCTSCHTPHPREPKASPVRCTSCHDALAQSDLSAHAKGVACTGCHVPHAFALTADGPSPCVSCHKKRLDELARHPGHQTCSGCHTTLPHGGMGAEKPCASCHVPEAGQVHEGHRTCTGCHDAHTGARPPAVCASCHREQAVHLSPKHGDCQRCHEPHAATPKPQIASCVGCHDVSKLPGLHQIAEHRARCDSCHGVHAAEPPAAPPKCLSCHRDMTEHQPEATRCNGCHAFRTSSPGRKP